MGSNIRHARITPKWAVNRKKNQFKNWMFLLFRVLVLVMLVFYIKSINALATLCLPLCEEMEEHYTVMCGMIDTFHKGNNEFAVSTYQTGIVITGLEIAGTYMTYVRWKTTNI